MKTQKYVIFIKQSLKINILKIKNIAKVETIVNIQRNIEGLHNSSNYDYHFIIKELTKEVTCLGENTEKYITATVQIEKKLQELIENREKIILYII